ncbi:25212_t:CDS:1, partial [Racocetra persica]
FYHWDSLGGANWGYAEGLVRELLSQIHSTDNLNLKQFLVKRQEVRQNNGWECGIAIIATMKRIREKYSGSIKDIELGEFDFKKVREELRMKYLQEHS